MKIPTRPKTTQLIISGAIAMVCASSAIAQDYQGKPFIATQYQASSYQGTPAYHANTYPTTSQMRQTPGTAVQSRTDRAPVTAPVAPTSSPSPQQTQNFFESTQGLSQQHQASHQQHQQQSSFRDRLDQKIVGISGDIAVLDQKVQHFDYFKDRKKIQFLTQELGFMERSIQRRLSLLKTPECRLGCPDLQNEVHNLSLEARALQAQIQQLSTDVDAYSVKNQIAP